MEVGLKLPVLPVGMEFEGLDFGKNISLLLSPNLVDDEVAAGADPEYEQFLADVWVGIVLTLMVLSCVCCMCSCLLYHKFQQWKRSVLDTRETTTNIEAGNPESESLPSYTIASGLPSYEEALEQLKKVKELGSSSTKSQGTAAKSEEGAAESTWVPRTPPTPVASLSVIDLFQRYRNGTPEAVISGKPS